MEEESEAGTSGHTNGKHKTMVEQVCEAIGAIGLPRKGASAQAVRKFIFSKYEESEHNRLKARLNKAFAKGIENGLLVRPASSKDSVGATGYFLLAKQNEKKAPAPSNAIAIAKEAMTKRLVPDKLKTKKSDKQKDVVKVADSKPTKPKSKPDKGEATTSKKSNKTEEMASDAKGKKNESGSKTLKKSGNKTLKSQTSEQSDIDEPKTAQSRAVKKSSKIPETDNIPVKSKAAKTEKSTKVLKKKEKVKKQMDNEDEDRSSDSEFLVKKKARKSLKSYSSDSQLMGPLEKEKPILSKRNGPKQRRGIIASSPAKPKAVESTFTK